MIRIAGFVVLVHLVEIAVWGGYYALSNGTPDLSSAFYFSAVIYTTTGYGDLVLMPPWRVVGAVEPLTGIY